MTTYTILGYLGDTTLQQVNVPVDEVDFVVSAMEAVDMEVVVFKQE